MNKGEKLNNGRYVIVDKLGDGSEGTVYSVKDTQQSDMM